MGKRHSQKVNMPPPPRSTRPQERQMQYGPDPASAANQYHRDEENVQHSASQPRQDPRIPSRPANNNSRSAGHNRRNNKDTNKDQTWFDQNNTAIPVPQLSTDGEPPFHPHRPGSLSSDTSSQTNVPARQGQHRTVAHFSQQHNTAGTERTDSGDFRSIIDDLTVENRELKERLRAFEAAQSPAPEVQQDRLFEVKVHGLPTHQKQELVETLQAFAQRVEVLNQQSLQHAESAVPYVSVNRSVQPHGKPTTTSADRNETSYASASASGQLSRTTPDPIQPSTSKKPRRVTAQPIEGTPTGLLYKGYDSSMTEREKKVMVVKRLEHLFSGEGKRHSKSKKAGSSPDATTGFDQITQRMREAQILPSVEDSAEDRTTPDGPSMLDDDNTTQPSDDNEATDPQRETRLLDLDPDRVQQPQENIKYIRHLLPSKNAEKGATESSSISEWVYLNLLMSMAQLHMLNVTPDFVRSAITEVSTRFELSTDRQKVRWHGGPDSKSGSDSDRAIQDTTDSSDSERRKQGHSISTGTTGVHNYGNSNFASSSNQGASAHGRRRHDLEYKPLFVKPRRLSAHHPYQDDSASAYLPRSTIDGDAYGSALGTMVTGATNISLPRSDAGPIVFFSGALFVTDLSGDSAEVLAQQHRSRNSDHGYKRALVAPLGTAGRPKRHRPSRPARSDSYPRTPKRPFKDYSKVAEGLQQDDRLKTPERVTSDDANSNDLKFDPKWTDDGKSASPQQRIVMEASGIGGTKPDDNFVVIVETAHPKMRSEFHKRLQADVASALDPNRRAAKLLHMIEEAKHDPVVSSRSRKGKHPASQSRHEKARSAPIKITVLSKRELRLQPSETPPPAQLWHDDSSSDADSDISMDSTGTDQEIQVLKYSPHNLSGEGEGEFAEEEEPEVDDDGPYDDDNDGSIDMMGHDRMTNPDLVAERESEYARNLRLTAIEDPRRQSGSGGATAGDEEEDEEEERETSDIEKDDEEGDDSGDNDEDASMGS